MKEKRIGDWIVILMIFSFNLLIINPVVGQETEIQQDPKFTFPKKGCKALLFQINENFTLSDFQGALISMKWHFSEKSAIRLGLNIGGDFTFSHENQSYYISDSSFHGLSKTEDRNIDIGLSVQYTWYVKRRTDVKFFYAIGPTFMYQSFYKDYSQVKYFPNKVPYKYGIGFIFNMGVEFFLFKNVSLLVEYGLSASYWHEQWVTRYESSEVLYSEGVIDSFAFSPLLVKFGVAFYF
ncbi:hypothetical protein ACFL6A_00295 [bacterium]